MPFIVLLTIAAVVLICGFTIKFGDPVLRLGAIWIFVNIVLHGLVSLFFVASPTLHLVCDGIYATGLLPLAFFSVSPWIGALAFLACGSFILQSIYLLWELKTDLTFVIINNLVTVADLGIFVAGTLVAIYARRRLSGDVVADLVYA